MEKLAIRACTDLIHDRRFQIHLPLTVIECVVDALTPRMTCVDAAGSRLKRKHSEKSWPSNHHAAWHVLARPGLAEKGIKCILTASERHALGVLS